MNIVEGIEKVVGKLAIINEVINIVENVVTAFVIKNIVVRIRKLATSREHDKSATSRENTKSSTSRDTDRSSESRD